MYKIDSEFSAGAIVVKRGELPRYNEFYDSLENLYVPKGSLLLKLSGLEFVRNLNGMIAECLALDKVKWIWIIDDDHSFEYDDLMKLLSHKVDVIVPLVSMRSFPFDSVIIEGKRKSFNEIKDNDKHLIELSHGTTVGAAGMLLNKDVFNTMSSPWFTVGGVFSDAISEDVCFAKRLWEYGFSIHVATNVCIDHITPMKLRPYKKEDGTFGVKIMTLSGQIPWSLGVS